MTISTDSAPTRLPRYRRAQREMHFALTARDLMILKTVEDFRLLDSAHVQSLIEGSPQQILRRLQGLFHAGFLDRVTPRVTKDGGSPRMVYAVTNKGMAYLQKEGLVKEVRSTDLNGNNRDLRDLSVEHMLLVSHIRTLFTLACRTRPDLELQFWREGRALYDSIEVVLNDARVHLPVAPDAFFGIVTPKGRTFFLLEADRGTMTVKRFNRKLIAYAEWWRERGHEKKFAIKHFRVLSVTTSAIRQGNLIEAARAAEGVEKSRTGMFLFANTEQLPLERPEIVFQCVWNTLDSNELHALIA